MFGWFNGSGRHTPRKTVLENGEDGDHSGSEAPKPDVAKRWFRLRRKEGGKWRHKARHGKRVDQEDFEMGEVPQDKDKRGIGAFWIIVEGTDHSG